MTLSARDRPAQHKLVFVRHGQTFANVKRVLDTRLPGSSLTEVGQEQARTFGIKRLSANTGLLVTSEASRAQETGALARQAAHVAASAQVGVGSHSGFGSRSEPMDMRVMGGLYETQVGEAEGSNDFAAHREWLRVYQEWLFGNATIRMPGGESAAEVFERFFPAIKTLTHNELHSRDVFVVSHGAAIRLVAAKLAGVSPSFAMRATLPNTGTIILEPPASTADPLREGSWSCTSWNGLLPLIED